MVIALETILVFANRDVRANKPKFFKKLNECVVNKRNEEKSHRLDKELEAIAFKGKFPSCSSPLQAFRAKGLGYTRWRKRFQKEIRENIVQVIFMVEMTDSCHCYLQHRLIESIRDSLYPLKDGGGYTPTSSSSETTD